MATSYKASIDDLTTLDQVRAYVQVDDGDIDSGLVQHLIRMASRYVIQFCGRRALNRVISFTDFLDGSGGDTQFVSEWPIRTVSSVSVSGVAVPASPDGVLPGWTNDTFSIILLPGTLVPGIPFVIGGSFDRFPRGKRNVKVVYSAGYDATSDPPGNPDYNGAPDDLGFATTFLVAQNYKRKDWVDQASKTIAAGESVTFRDWQWPPFIESVVQEYKQPWVV